MPVAPLPVAPLTPELEISPYELFRGLREGRPYLLFDVRQEPGALTLAGARPYPETGGDLPAGVEVVLFDDEGKRAPALAREAQERGRKEVRALYGGLALYDYALDPAVVGEERFLVSS